MATERLNRGPGRVVQDGLGVDLSDGLLIATSSIFRRVLHQVGGDQDLLREIAGMLLRISPAWLDELQRHFDRAAAMTARVDCGSFSKKLRRQNIGGGLAEDAMSRLENAARGGSLDESASIWPECRRQFLCLLEAVELFLATT